MGKLRRMMNWWQTKLTHKQRGRLMSVKGMKGGLQSLKRYKKAF